MTPDELKEHQRLYRLAWARAHPECGRARSRKYAAKHSRTIRAYRVMRKEQERATNRAHYAAHHEHFQQYRQNNKAAITKTKAAWVANNQAATRAIDARHRAAKRSAMPAWANRAAICAFYRAAQRLTLVTGIKHEVDHIIPLNSHLVCGLHVACNLQILTKTENRRKHNRLLAA